MPDVPVATPFEVVDDTPCLRCGYNLRGLPTDGRCPECGNPVADSIRGDLLKFADPDWLRRLHLGASLKLWGIVLAIVLPFGAGLLAAFAGGRPLLEIMYPIGLLGAALGLWATVAITTQDPRVALQEDPITLRRTIRAAAVTSFVGSILQGAPLGGAFGLAAHVTGQLLALAAWVVVFGELVYFRRFARRIPDDALALSTTRLMWLSVFVGVGAIGLSAFFIATTGGRTFAVGAPAGPGAAGAGPGGAAPAPVVPGMAFAFVSCFGGLLVLVSFVWYVGLLVRYRRAFRSAIDSARLPAA